MIFLNIIFLNYIKHFLSIGIIIIVLQKTLNALFLISVKLYCSKVRTIISISIFNHAKILFLHFNLDYIFTLSPAFFSKATRSRNTLFRFIHFYVYLNSFLTANNRLLFNLINFFSKYISDYFKNTRVVYPTKSTTLII